MFVDDGVAARVTDLQRAEDCVSIENGKINVSAAHPVAVSIASADGRICYQGKVAQLSIALPMGCYVVRVDSKIKKVLLK